MSWQKKWKLFKLLGQKIIKTKNSTKMKVCNTNQFFSWIKMNLIYINRWFSFFNVNLIYSAKQRFPILSYIQRLYRLYTSIFSYWIEFRNHIDKLYLVASRLYREECKNAYELEGEISFLQKVAPNTFRHRNSSADANLLAGDLYRIWKSFCM